METLHTKVVPGDIEFNSPTSYKIIHKETDKVTQNINIQKGPVKENGLNGIFIEDLILICINQLEHFQASEFKCRENESTLRHLYDALATTRSRQYERQLRNVQGKNLK
ncbi:hypothetical protein FDE94_09260 [Clostridium botulinum]|nr:hypothetical protein [Clostridium botulinum]